MSCSAMVMGAEWIFVVAVITAPVWIPIACVSYGYTQIRNRFRKKNPVDIEEVKPHQA